MHFSVTSKNFTGKEWVDHLKGKGFMVSGFAKRLILSECFKPTSGIKSEVVIVNGSLFEGEDRLTENIIKYARLKNLARPNPEVACLIREALSDEDIEAMGISWIMVMHEFLTDKTKDEGLLFTGRGDCGRLLGGFLARKNDHWNKDNGFAFVMKK